MQYIIIVWSISIQDENGHGDGQPSVEEEWEEKIMTPTLSLISSFLPLIYPS